MSQLPPLANNSKRWYFADDMNVAVGRAVCRFDRVVIASGFVLGQYEGQARELNARQG